MTAREPDPAERARTTLSACPLPEITAHGLVSLVPDHAVDRDGRPVLLVPDDSELAGIVAGSIGDVPVRLRAAHLRSLHVPDRVRTRVELHGRLDVVEPGGLVPAPSLHTARDGRSLLRIRPDHVTVDGEAVEPDAYRCAAPDPFAHSEAELLRRLLGEHPETVAALCGLLEPRLVAQATEIAPSGLDRFGIAMLTTGPAGSSESRIPFPVPVSGTGTLLGALQALLAAARTRCRPE